MSLRINDKTLISRPRLRRYLERPHPLGQRYRTFGVRRRSGQENQGLARLSHEHGAQLRRSAAFAGRLSAHREALGGDPRQLEAGRVSTLAARAESFVRHRLPVRSGPMPWRAGEFLVAAFPLLEFIAWLVHFLSA